MMDGAPADLVIECAGHTAIDSSTEEYEVEGAAEAESWYEWCIPWFIGVAAVVGFVIIAWWRMRGGGTEGPPPDVTPPPGTG